MKQYMSSILSGRKKLQSVAIKENGVILEPTGKSYDLKGKTSKRKLYNLPDTKKEKEAMGRKSWSKK